MGKGRPPAPLALVKLKGDPSKRRSNTIEPMPSNGEPPMPDYFQADAIAVQAWNDLMERLGDMNLLSPADQASYELYVTTYSRWRKAYNQVQKFGAVCVQKETKQFYTNPFVHEMNNCQTMLNKLHIEFGLTPAARSRMRMQDTKAGSDNPWTRKYGA